MQLWNGDLRMSLPKFSKFGIAILNIIFTMLKNSLPSGKGWGWAYITKMNKYNLFLGLSLLVVFSCACTKTTPLPEVITPKINISSVTLFEGNDGTTPFRLKVNLSQATTNAVSFDFTTEAAGAKVGEDFIENKGTLTIPAGSTAAEIKIEVVTDTLKEGDEDFKVVFSNVKNGTLNQNEVTCTIRNDDTYVLSSNDGYISPDNYSGYKLAWADEFNATKINTADWGYDIGGSGWGNNESQYYTNDPKNAYLKNGKLVIEAIKEKVGGKEYSSARMLTKGKHEFMFGRIDIRAKLPKGQGIWPALWMLGANIDQVGWPACDEIDIMELLGHDPKTSYGTIHWGKKGDTQSQNTQGVYKLSNGKNFSDEFHVFSLDWEKDKLNILVDDNVIFTTTASKLGAGNYIFNNPNFFIFNVAVGGNWPGYPDATTTFPVRMEVDYVRVFQK
jgi:beta-glucanase (GH16 family)